MGQTTRGHEHQIKDVTLLRTKVVITVFQAAYDVIQVVLENYLLASRQHPQLPRGFIPNNLSAAA